MEVVLLSTTSPILWAVPVGVNQNPAGGPPFRNCKDLFNLGCPILAFFARVGDDAAGSEGIAIRSVANPWDGESVSAHEPGKVSWR